MSESIVKDAIEALIAEYPHVERSTLQTVCKCQLKWALSPKGDPSGLCKEASHALVFVREPEVFIEQMKTIAKKAIEQYRAGISDIKSESET